MAFQQKNSQKKLVSEHRVTISNTNFNDWQWMSIEKMELEMGPAKAEHWRSSGKLKDRGDLLTGSRLPQFIEYRVPKEWQRMSEDDLRALQLTAEQDGEEADDELLKGFINPDGAPEIKLEPKSELKKLSEKVAQFKLDLNKNCVY